MTDGSVREVCLLHPERETNHDIRDVTPPPPRRLPDRRPSLEQGRRCALRQFAAGVWRFRASEFGRPLTSGPFRLLSHSVVIYSKTKAKSPK
jgi:hypothetical protein